MLVDLYSPSTLYQQAVWSTGLLANGAHTVTIAWTGQKNPAATYTYVDLDALDVVGTLRGSSTTTTTLPPLPTTTTSSYHYDDGASYRPPHLHHDHSSTTTTSSTTSTTLPSGGTTRYEQTDPNLIYAGTWTTLSGSSYSGGSMAYTSASGAAVTISFSGTSLTWIARPALAFGKAQVSLDGGAPVLVDLYSPSTLYQQAVWSTGLLANGAHTVTIAWTGQKNPAALYTYIDLDALDVVGVLTASNTSSSLSTSGTLHSMDSYQLSACHLVDGQVVLFGGS